MSNIVINGKLQHCIDFHKTSDDFSEMAIAESREAFMQKQKEDTEKLHTPKINNRKISRNNPCPCGCGKKFKKCCINKEHGK